MAILNLLYVIKRLAIVSIVTINMVIVCYMVSQSLILIFYAKYSNIIIYKFNVNRDCNKSLNHQEGHESFNDEQVIF